MLICFKEFSGKDLHCPTINIHYAAIVAFHHMTMDVCPENLMYSVGF